MLKDLEQRNNEQNQSYSSTVPVTVTRSSKKLIVTILVAVVLLNVVGLFVWNLYTENQQLKQDNSDAYVKAELETSAITETEVPTEILSQVANKPVVVIEKTPVESELIPPQQAEITDEVADTTATTAKAAQERDIPAQPPLAKISRNQSVANEKPKKELSAVNNQQPPAEKASFSISRRQLSPAELAKQKMAQAEKALSDNDIEKAEQRFEEILMLQPENKQARKKLAALWFGRQSYQPAVNLLSQGIALDANDSEFRLMKARIYLNRGNHRAALTTLQGLPDSPNQEYQLLMANVAQQSGEYDLAIRGYKNLVAMEPQSSRWRLGLAIAYDSNSQFELAQPAYENALAFGDLSSSSASFAQQRLQELGE